MGYNSCLQALQSLVVEALRIHAFQQAILLHAARDESAAAKNKSKFLSDLLFFLVENNRNPVGGRKRFKRITPQQNLVEKG